MTERRPAVSDETACAICGQHDCEVVGRRDRDGRPLRTTICRHCGLVWTNPRPSEPAIEEYYRQHYRTDYQHSRTPSLRKVLRGMLGALERRRRILPLLRPDTRVLDVGCGAGELVYVLRATGVAASGLEPDDVFAQFARDVLEVPVHTGSVRSDVFSGKSFDVVTMFHSLEHMAEPVQTLATAAAWLTPFGNFVIEVPNVDARCQAPQHRFHYAHLFSFSQGSLTAVALRAGLVQFRTELTGDEGNIIAFFRKGTTSSLLHPDSTSYSRTREVLRSHTTVRHYLSTTPYARALMRLRCRQREDRLLRRLQTMDDILEWAARGAVEESG